MSRRVPFSLLLLVSLLVPGGLQAAASWPPSATLLVGEVVTGGDSGSDEYVELYNAGASSAELGGLELVYVSASGKSVTRKRTWSDRRIAPGGRLLLANVDGAYAARADQTYSGGFSAAGGSLVLREVGSEVIDALSWGNAASAFVEGLPGAAPDAGSSLERRPGGGGANSLDTNDNAADTVINPRPVPEGSDASGPEPTPKPTPKPTPRPTPKATPEPTPRPTPTPLVTQQPAPTSVPSPPPATTPPPTPTTTPTPTTAPTPTSEPTVPPATAPPTARPTPPATTNPSATPSPEPRPSASPAPTPPPASPPAPTPTPEATLPPTVPIAQARATPIGEPVTVAGTVTVQPGRLLVGDTMVLQDESGGIAVRLPEGSARASFSRGSIVWVHGPLAAPYGNLEARPEDPAAVRVIGSGGLPRPKTISADGLREANEGLLAELGGVVTDVDRYASGAVSIRLRDSSGDGRVYAFAAIGLERDAVRRGDRIRALGIVGQRASRSGADDGHRLWLRGRGDLEVVSGPPSDPKPPGGGADGERPKAKRVRISQAALGRTVTIEGVVTSKAGLIDADARRVTIEDRSGAILVRYPADVRPAGVGRRIRVTGEVGTWYDAPQLEAAAAPRHKARVKVKRTPLTRPPDETHEWSLVTVQVRIMEVSRAGETWRAEAKLRSGASLPVVGLAASGIDGELLEPGREARITGIVRRAHPSATDQRFGIVPRTRSDVRLGALSDDDDDDEPDGAGDDGGELGGYAGSSGEGVPVVSLGTLARHDGRTVRVGGRVREVRGRRLALEDGTASGVVRLGAAADPVGSPIAVGEIVNATGRVKRRGDGRREVVVTAAADLRRASQLVAVRSATTAVSGALTVAAAADEPDAGSMPATAPPHGPAGGLGAWLLPAAAVSLASSLLLLAGAAILAWRIRRRPRPAGAT